MSAALLEVVNVNKSFSGLQALRNVTLSISKGRIHGLIGPNGAGKTTLFNLISGMLPVTSGTIRFDGRDITRLRPHQAARCGIARTYQLVRPFHELNVKENIEVGLYFGRRELLPAHTDVEAEAYRYMDWVGLAHKGTESVTALNLGERKRLEIAKALAASPQLLLLDEVLAGLNPTETANAIELLQRIRAVGVTIFMIEHNMQAIMSACEHIFVLHHGEMIGEGSPQQISADPKVVEAYLGRKDLKLERRRRAASHA
jgi:branched-chain amino acid transport system ATP-binding protein